MHQEAYDLNYFANRPTGVENRIRVVQGGKRNRKQAELMGYIRLTLGLALLLGLTISLLYSYAVLNEITMDVQWTQSELAEARSEYDYLSSTLTSKTNLKAVEEIAGTQLGLMKVDKNQVTYINLEDENVITRPESTTARAVKFLQCLGLNIAGELKP